MPISDAYVVQYLLQRTSQRDDPLLWTERDPTCFTASPHDVEVELSTLHHRAGSQIYLTILAVPERIDICEPQSKGFFNRKYDNQEAGNLADLLRELVAVVQRQCASRFNRTSAGTAQIRESLYRRVVGMST